jgi:hypothetical protein
MRRFPWAFAALNLAVICFHINLFAGWNQVSRALPLLSLVEEGTLQIDARHELTGDKALIGGHYYSEKAPATTFLAFPFYALARAALAGSRYAVEGPRAASGTALNDAILVGTFVCSAVPFLAILLIFVSRLQAVAGPGAVASPRLIAVWLLYGTYVFVYADYFFGHLLAALLLLVAYIGLFERNAPLWAGLAVGAAFFAEYPCLVALGVWGAQCVAGRRTRDAVRLVAGAVPGVLAALIYNFAITGNALTPAYKYVSQPEFERQTQLFGFGGPQPEALWELVFGQARGLLFHAPVLLAFLLASASVGFVRPASWARSPVRALLAAHLLLYSSFYMWHGGSCYGPRFLIPAAVLVLYRVGQRLVAEPVFPALVLYLAGGVGLAMNLVVLNTTLHIPAGLVLPFSSFLIPYLLGGLGADQTLAAHLFSLSTGARFVLWAAAFAAVLQASRGRRPSPAAAAGAVASLPSPAA